MTEDNNEIVPEEERNRLFELAYGKENWEAIRAKSKELGRKITMQEALEIVESRQKQATVQTIKKHMVTTAGYGALNDGLSTCDACDWTDENDYFGTHGTDHAYGMSKAYYDLLEEQIGTVKDILVGFYGCRVDDTTPDKRLERIANLLGVPKDEWDWDPCTDIPVIVQEALSSQSLHLHGGIVYHPDYGGHCLGCFND